MPVCLAFHFASARGPGGLQKKKNKWEVEEENILIAEWEKFDQSKRRGYRKHR